MGPGSLILSDSEIHSVYSPDNFSCLLYLLSTPTLLTLAIWYLFKEYVFSYIPVLLHLYCYSSACHKNVMAYNFARLHCMAMYLSDGLIGGLIGMACILNSYYSLGSLSLLVFLDMLIYLCSLYVKFNA